MKIYAPNKQANGVYASVMFVDGVGETDNLLLIKWFESHGYTLEKCDELPQVPHETCDEPKEPDFDAMTPNELRQWAIENGYGTKIRNTRNKAKLLEILRG